MRHTGRQTETGKHGNRKIYRETDRHRNLSSQTGRQRYRTERHADIHDNGRTYRDAERQAKTQTERQATCKKYNREPD